MEAPPPGQLTSPVLWAERLGAFDAAWLAARTALTGEEVRYDEHQASAYGLKIAAVLGWRPAELTLSGPDASGDPLNYRRESALDEAVGTFVRERLDGRPERLKLAFKAHFAGRLVGRATFLVMAAEAASKEPAREHRYFVVSHPANGLLSRTFDVPLVSRPAQTEALRQIAAPLVLLARAAWAGLTSQAVRNNLTGKPAVWTEYYHLDIGGFISRLFWKDHVDPEKWDRVLYMDRDDSPCDDEQIRRVEAFGMRWIDASRPWSLAGLGLGEAARKLGILLRPGLPWWARAFELHYEATASVWAAAFRKFNVRLLSEHQELSWLPVAQAEGIERAGGAMFGLHWSDFPFLTEPTHPSPEQVFFVWGVTNKRWLEGKGNGSRHILPCGLWIPSDAKKSAELKTRLGPAEFSLAVFDSSCSYNIFYSAKMLADFLDAVLSLLESHRGWKALFKPKSAHLYEDLPDGANLMRRLKALEKEGRVIVLGHGISPIDAALACDLSVCFGFNSAGVVAGARGARAVHWDAAGWTRHPLRSDPAQRIVYPALESFKAALAAAPNDPGIGDFSRWRRLSDHFGDQRAGKRVGEWISDALASSPDSASDRYRTRHGIGADFEGPGEWWTN